MPQLLWDQRGKAEAPQGGYYMLDDEHYRGEPAAYKLWYYPVGGGRTVPGADFNGWPTKARVQAQARRHAAAALGAVQVGT